MELELNADQVEDLRRVLQSEVIDMTLPASLFDVLDRL